MRQNWWKLAVVAVLVVVVGVVLAAKSKAPVSKTRSASEAGVTTSADVSDAANPKDTATTATGNAPAGPKSADKAADAGARAASPDTRTVAQKPAEMPKPVSEKPAPGGAAEKAEKQPAKDSATASEAPAPQPVADVQPPEAAPKRLPKLLELGADKCIPCKMMKPIIEELEKEYEGRLDVQFIDVWKTEGIAKRYGIKTIPTQIFYDENGKELFRHQGFFSKEDILKTFEEYGIKL